MKSIKGALVSVLFVAACGNDAQRGVDPMSFMPKLPVAHVATKAPITPSAPSVKRATSEDGDELAIPTKLDDAMVQGRALAAKGETAQAKRMFEAAILLDKKSAEPHLELARLYIASGDRGLAMAAANKAVKLAPLSSQAWNTKGRAELNRFAYDDAIEAFTKAVELNQDNVWAWNNLGYTELQLKKYDEAVEHLSQATVRPGAAGFMFNNLGTALEHLDRLDEARTAFDGGAKLGSKEAIASRKRLEGVKSIAITEPAAKPDVKPDVTHTFENGEGAPVPVEATEPDDAIDAGDGSASDAGVPAPQAVDPVAE